MSGLLSKVLSKKHSKNYIFNPNIISLEVCWGFSLFSFVFLEKWNFCLSSFLSSHPNPVPVLKNVAISYGMYMIGFFVLGPLCMKFMHTYISRKAVKAELGIKCEEIVCQCKAILLVPKFALRITYRSPSCRRFLKDQIITYSCQEAVVSDLNTRMIEMAGDTSSARSDTQQQAGFWSNLWKSIYHSRLGKMIWHQSHNREMFIEALQKLKFIMEDRELEEPCILL